MKETKLILEISIIILLITIGFLIPFVLSGRITNSLDYYSYTKAICNESNYCEDYILNCNGKELTRLSPTGFAVQHNKEWIDPRENADKFCD